MWKTSLYRVSVLVLALMLVLTMSVFAGLGNGNGYGHWKWSGGIHAAEFGGGHGFESWFYGSESPEAVWATHYILVEGVIESIDDDDDDDYYLIYVETEDGDNVIYKVTDDAFVLDLPDPEFLDLEYLYNEWDDHDNLPFIAVVDKNATYSEGDDEYDPETTDDVAGFILEANIDELALSVFDSDLVDLDGELQLDVTADDEDDDNDDYTVIRDLNDNDELSEEDVRNTESLAYFTNIDTDGSDPDVADAEFILILNRTPKMVRESFDNSGYKYIPLRAAARSCNYECYWTSAEHSIRLVRGENIEILIRLGETEYSKNGDEGEFSAPPMLKNGKTFVPKEIIEIMEKAGKNL